MMQYSQCDGRLADTARAHDSNADGMVLEDELDDVINFSRTPVKVGGRSR